MPRHQVLIVQADSAHRNFCQALLEKEGFSVACARNCEQAAALMSRHVMDVVLLDLNLPDGNGLELYGILRLEHQMPVLMMTSRDNPAQWLSGFEPGAVDYLVKPFHSRELLFRLQSVLNKNPPIPGEPVQGGSRPVAYGLWQLDREELLLRSADDLPIKLTAGQAEIMLLLLGAHGRTVSGASLRQAVAKGWGGNSKSVGVLISRLRRHAGLKPGIPGGIETVHGIGYRLNAPEPV